jgi:hypothetical protein
MPLRRKLFFFPFRDDKMLEEIIQGKNIARKLIVKETKKIVFQHDCLHLDLQVWMVRGFQGFLKHFV